MTTYIVVYSEADRIKAEKEGTRLPIMAWGPAPPPPPPPPPPVYVERQDPGAPWVVIGWAMLIFAGLIGGILWWV